MISQLLPLLWKNLWRNRRRTVLTICGVAAAIFVVAALGAAVAGMTFPVREVGATRLLKVREKARANVLASRLPQSFEDRVGAADGVAAATGVLSDLAVLGEEGIHVFVRGVDPERYRQVRALEIVESDWASFAGDRKAALVGHRLMRRMDWQVGDEISIDVINLRVQIVGLIPAQGIDLENHLLVQRGYLQVARSAEGQVTYLLVDPAEDVQPEKVAAAIDTLLEYSSVPTATATSAAYAEAVVEDFMGFLDYLDLMKWITILITVLGAANAVAMSVRERTPEIGVLKALGFTPQVVSVLVLLESTLLAAFGGLIGLGCAALMIGAAGSDLSGLELTGAGVAQGFLLALVVGLAGGLVPALSAARLRPVDALRLID
jgi:putative ABC transport system permease protein